MKYGSAYPSNTSTRSSVPNCPAPRLRVNDPSGLPSDRAYLCGARASQRERERERERVPHK